MTDVVVECVRVRGPHAARLARVAATALPDALERALAGLPSARVDRVTVRLDIDIAGTDDATIAAIWADQVRAEVERNLPARARASGTVEAVRGATPTPRVSLPDAVAAARAWLARTEPRGPVPVAALALASDLPEGSRHTAAALLERDLLVSLDSAIARERLRARMADSPVPKGGDSPGHVDPPSPAGDPGTRFGAPQMPGESRTSGAAARPVEAGMDGVAVPAPEAAAAAERVGTLAELASASGERDATLDLAALTDAAGLALLYPWLADLCRTAVSLHPGLDEAEVRAHALATVVDPNNVGLVRDPLVRLLAGATASVPAASIRLAHADSLAQEADRVLASFASLLPGFEASSPAFVRREWIARVGLVEALMEPARLTAATHPLDVVLIRLPYPMTLFKLPWSPPVSVRFRP